MSSRHARISLLGALLVASLQATLSGCKSTESNAGQNAAASASSGSNNIDRTATRARWHYTFRPSADLARLDTELCFSGRVPERLDAQVEASRESFVKARRVARSAGTAAPAAATATTATAAEGTLVPGPGGIDLSSLRPGDCIDYALDLAATMRRAGSARKASAYGEDLWISPDFWLWKPRPLGDAVLTASFELPAGLHAAVPWPPDDAGGSPGRYLIPRTTFDATIYGGFSRTEPVRLDIPPRPDSPGATSAELRVFLLGDANEIARPVLLGWLQRSAFAVSALFGEFPVKRAQVLIVPWAGDEVVFGSVSKGGGASIHYICGTSITDRSLSGDWVGVHEMFHLSEPMFEEDAAWLNEGLATYYEPLLRARAGLISAARAWEILHDGFQRGATQVTERTLAEESRNMRQTGNYWRVYWGGAAIALLADVALRQQGRSLDVEMRAIRARYAADPERMWQTDALLGEVASGKGSLHSFAQEHLPRTEFPDLTAAYQALGLRFDKDGHLTPDDSAAARALRESFTSPGPSAPSAAPASPSP